jgi:hypothetical protein
VAYDTTPAIYRSTGWGPDDPSLWRRIDTPCAAISIGPGSDVDSVIASIGGVGDVIVSVGAPWIGLGFAPITIRPHSSKDLLLSAWPVSAPFTQVLELLVYPSSPVGGPNRQRAPRRSLLVQDQVGLATADALSAWCSGAAEVRLLLRNAGGFAIDYSIEVDTIAAGSTVTSRITEVLSTGAIPAASTFREVVLLPTADRIRLSCSSIMPAQNFTGSIEVV